jgi:hypothetical protein
MQKPHQTADSDAKNVANFLAPWKQLMRIISGRMKNSRK